ncbi:hypothetical protein GCM10010191_86980 [Actinomadura vinacea]|uniref:Uncharacterized protein n=1 Tax=Actinomadura vinacea TaxID=115336 RepID=A0ABN3KEJ1_9ACTN
MIRAGTAPPVLATGFAAPVCTAGALVAQAEASRADVVITATPTWVRSRNRGLMRKIRAKPDDSCPILT